VSREADELRELVRVLKRVLTALDRQYRESQRVIHLLRLLVEKDRKYPSTVGICVKVE
jgi:hypothetical protein